MNRLYVVEPNFTLTGAAADHRLRLGASQIEGLIQGQSLSGAEAAWLAAAREDLESHAGRCLVATGARQPEAVHAAVEQWNRRLGNVGKTVHYPSPAARARAGTIQDLARRLAAGQVQVLVILGGNPAFNAPAELEFGQLIRKAGQL
jgi:molybdopterin-containing oxidoreductase family iron-sulfur binding subunit